MLNEYYCFISSMICADNYYQMHSLKNTLGKNYQSDEPSKSGGNPSKNFSKAKNGSMWALDPEEDNQQLNAKDSNLNKIQEFEQKILNAFSKDSTFSEIIFFQIIQQIQGISEGMDEQIRLQLVEKATIKTSETQEQNLKNFAAGFLECLAKRIKKLKKKEKKVQLQEYDKIVKTNFKKKGGAQFIDEADFDNKETAMKPIRNNAINAKSSTSKAIGEGSTSKRNGSASSNEGKLAKLISNVSLKDEKKQEENEEAHNHEESISFSSVVSQSMAVRQRRQKEPKNKEKQQVPQKLQQKQSDGNDAAFIFYRPKAGKKK